MSAANRRLCAAAALSFYAIHAGQHVWRGHWEDALWVCHLANLVLAAGFLCAWRRAVGVALMWLLLGDALWVTYLLGGGEFIPTSLLTHVGGLLLAIFGSVRWGIPRGTWWLAVTGMVGVQILARMLTPAEANVNAAWRIYGDWTRVFASYPAYIVISDGGAAVLFWMIETAWRTLQGRTEPGRRIANA